MRNRRSILWLAALTLAVGPLPGQTPDWQDPARAIGVRAEESPLAVASRDCSASEIRPRGGAVVIDLNCRLELRNDSKKAIRGAALAVSTLPSAGTSSAGGRASVFAPSLNVAPGDAFPIEVRVRLVRPLPGQAAGPLAEIAVDGALFTDLAFAGVDKTGSSERLTRYEAAARRDRSRLQALLAKAGKEGLRGEMLATLERRARRPTLEARLSGGSGRTVVASAETRNRVALALVNLEQAPLRLLAGEGQGGAVSDAPGLQIRNLSGKQVRAFEFAWLVSDESGRRERAAAVPFSGLSIAPGAEAEVRSGRRYKLRRRTGGTFQPSAMSGYLRSVEFTDGSRWSASHAELAAAALLQFEPVTPEELRLAAIYRREGVDGLVRELERMR